MEHNFKERQKRAFEILEGSSLLVFPPPTPPHTLVKTQNQDSLIHYLTGFHESDCALLLTNIGSPKATLFLQDNDAKAELWDGKRTGVKNAPSSFPVDQSFDIKSIMTELPRLIKGTQRLYYPMGLHPEMDRGLIEVRSQEQLLRGRLSHSWCFPIYDSKMISNQLRLVKTADEIECMRKAVAISKIGFDRIFRDVRPGMNERTVHGMLMGAFIENGAESEAYGSIVAGGDNACCLHYGKNNDPLNEGDLLLVDAGCQYKHYASDVTRCFPIGKDFSGGQKAIYEAVLEVQKAGIEAAKVGNTMHGIHQETTRNMAKVLIDIGLVSGSVDEVIENKSVLKYFPHGTGHYIGLDVHDAGDYVVDGDPVKLKAGMCFTVEPGIYVPRSDDSAPAEMRGVGVRIEDDVHITDNGPEVLTAEIVKEVDDLSSRY